MEAHGSRADPELDRWRRVYAGEEYYYGSDPGPVARRAVRYHRPLLPGGGRALDAGCGEGQDLAFLAECGYDATGIEFTSEGALKSRAMLEERGLRAAVEEIDLRSFEPQSSYDLVLAVNCVQFLGTEAPEVLRSLMALTSPGGVIGLSLFARKPEERALQGTLWLTTLDELLRQFANWQPLEAAQLWQWHASSSVPQEFLTLIARKPVVQSLVASRRIEASVGQIPRPGLTTED